MEKFGHHELTFHLMVEASPNALILVNSLGKIAFLNNFGEKLFQYQKEELIGRDLEIIIPSKYKNNHPSFLQSYLDHPVRRRMGENSELFALKKDGTEFPVEIGLNPIVTVDGILVLAAISDITERKKSESQFRLVVETAPSAIILVNTNGEITMANRQTELQFGYSNTELVGEKLEILIPDRFRSKHLSYRDAFLSNPESRSMGAGRDLFALRKDGTEFPAEIGLNPISTEDGTLILTSIIDITERKKHEEALLATALKIEEQNQELTQSEQKLKALNATKDKFFSIIAHDLKNPFNAILGLSGLLAEDYDSYSDDVKKNLLANINQSAETAYALLENLLAWAMSQHENTKLKKDEVKLLKLVSEGVSSYSSNARLKNIHIEIDIPEDLTVFVDHYSMNFVIGNLMNNAVKFTNNGGNINLSSRSANGSIEILIQDNGVGMSEEQKAKLFKIEENVSTLGTNNERGTGLGLILCKEYIEKNGGHIRVESEKGKGSLFIISLPENHKKRRKTG